MNLRFQLWIAFCAVVFSCSVLQSGFGQESTSQQQEKKSTVADGKSTGEKSQGEETASAKVGDRKASQVSRQDDEKSAEAASGTASEAKGNSVANADVDKPGKTKPSSASKPLSSSGKQKNFAITFNDLKFDMEKNDKFSRTMLNKKINGYHGGKVKIRGYIRPNHKQTGITKFIFVRDNKECCFGPQAAIFDNILVRLEKDKTVNYTVRPVTVEGSFVLKEYYGPDGNVWSLYRMYDAKIVR